MKLYIILTIFLTLAAALSPLAVLDFSNKAPEKAVTTAASAEKSKENETPTAQEEANKTIKVLRTGSGNVVEKEIYDYVKGAVCGEISPEYEKEAIKAQAVVCYTYALWLKKNADHSDLFDADVSDDPSKFQSFLDESELRDKWGEKFEEYSEKVNECINEVLGEYLEYDGEPIMACFHALSTGRTESAKNVWGNDVEYLQSVQANGDVLSPDIDSSVTLSEEKFKACAEKLDGVKLSGKSSQWVGKAKTTKSGYVTSIVIGSKTFSGNDVRSAFSLRSPAFTVEKTKDGFLFNVKGYGHLVGMSQYSADYMARQGASYKDILLHFFKGAELKKS